MTVIEPGMGEGRILFVPVEENGSRFYRFEGKLMAGEILGGALYECGVPRGMCT